jgi:membrane fusion protein, heavy metal efflux system
MYRKTVFFLLTYCLIFTLLSDTHEHKQGDSCAKANKREHIEAEDDHKVEKKEKCDDDDDHKVEKKEKCDDDDDHDDDDHKVEKKKKCDDDDNHDDDDHKDEKKEKCNDDDDHAEKDESSAVVLTKSQLKAIKLKLSKAKAKGLTTKIFLLGEVKYNRDRMAQIMPHMPGFVSKISTKEGKKVKAGEVLAVLQSHKLGELYAEYRSAKELELLTKKEFKIRRKLWDKKVVSELDYIKTRQEYADSQVARHRAEGKLKSLGLTPDIEEHNSHEKDFICTNYQLKSPINGTVISKNITIGENYPEDNEKVPFAVADLTKLWLDLNARQSDLPQLKKNMKITVQLGDGFSDFHGTIAYIAPNFNPKTRTVLVRVIMDNEKGLLKPGLYATGVVSVSGEDSKVVVPRSSVQIIAGEKVVFVPAGKGFAAAPVSTGRSADGSVEILSGLKSGQKYVSQGSFELKAVMITGGMDPHAGHGH